MEKEGYISSDESEGGGAVLMRGTQEREEGMMLVHRLSAPRLAFSRPLPPESG